MKSLISRLLFTRQLKLGMITIPLNLKLKQEKNYYTNIDSVADRHIISQLVQEGDTCFDIGANIGLTAAFFLENNALHVYAVEPVKRLAEKIKKLSSSKITVLNLACSNVDSNGIIYLSTGHDQGHTLKQAYTQKYRWIFKSNPKQVPVKIVKLDNLAYGKIRIDYLKIDAEGSEFEILQGAEKLLMAPEYRPRIMQLEINFEEEFKLIKDYLLRYYARIYRVFVESKTLKCVYFDTADSDPYDSIADKDIYLTSSPTFIATNSSFPRTL